MTNHFLSIQTLSRQELLNLMERAQSWVQPDGTLSNPPLLLKDKVVALLFFEKSTRTHCSFEIAAKKLGAHVLHLTPEFSSTQKGETLLDTVANLSAMGVDSVVIRHSEPGLPAWIAHQLGTHAPQIINAGDGTHEHPTQALLDVLTISYHKSDFSSLIVSIVGDIKHSRVARSFCYALNLLGIRQIRFIGPPNWMPEENYLPHLIRFDPHLHSGLKNTDVIMALRVQKERHESLLYAPTLKTFQENYCITDNALRLAKPDVILMHPGPVNRGVEIASHLIEGPHSVILEQVKLGVAARMAVLTQSCSPTTQ